MAAAIADDARRCPAGPPVVRSPDGDQRDLSGPGPAARGVTCPGSTETGRPPLTGIAAGRWTGPGRRAWTSCASPAAARVGPAPGRAPRWPTRRTRLRPTALT